MAATSLHDDVLLDSEECHESEADCAYADVDTFVGNFEGSGGGGSGNRSTALTGTLQAADLEEPQRTVWKVLMEMEKYRYRAGKEDQGAVALVLDLAKAFERVSFPVVWAWATHFSFRRKILRVLCGYFEHQRRVQFQGCEAEPLRTITAILPGSKWSCLLVTKICGVACFCALCCRMR